MIRINLFAGSGGRGGSRPVIDLGQKVTVACSVILVITVVVIGWRFWSMRQQAAQLAQELLAADQEVSGRGPGGAEEPRAGSPGSIHYSRRFRPRTPSVRSWPSGWG